MLTLACGSLCAHLQGEYGAKMLGKLKQMHVLIIGLRGLGVEVAKNLILAGPHTVQLHDAGLVQIQDLNTNFYLKKEDGQTSTEQRNKQKTATTRCAFCARTMCGHDFSSRICAVDSVLAL